MKSFEYEGVWWIPDNFDRQLVGNLSFSTERGLNLEIMGTFVDQTPGTIVYIGLAGLTPERHDTIFGMSREGKCITLRNCTRTGGSLNYPGLPKERFRCVEGFIGSKHVNVSQLEFYAISVEYTFLIDWLNMSGFKEFISWRGNRLKKYRLIFEYPVETKIEFDDVSFSFDYVFSKEASLRRTLGTQDIVLKIYHRNAMSMNEWLSLFVGPIQNLLSLATDKSNSINRIYVYHYTRGWQAGKRTRQHRKTEYIYQPPFSTHAQEDLTLNNMIFSFQELENPRVTFERWLAISNQLRTVCNLYFSTRYHPGKYQEPRFLSIIQAIELYHRLRYNTNLMEKSTFRALKKEIFKSMPKKYKPWIDIQTAHSNEPRLINRLSDIYDKCSNIMQYLRPDKFNFIKKVKDTRNYYTHYASGQDTAAKERELYWLTETLSYMLIFCLLQEIGFTSEGILIIMRRSQRFSEASERIKPYISEPDITVGMDFLRLNPEEIETLNIQIEAKMLMDNISGMISEEIAAGSEDTRITELKRILDDLQALINPR